MARTTGDFTQGQLTSITQSELAYEIDGGGSAISTGVKGSFSVPFACRIDKVTLLADQTGSAVVDIWKDTYSNYKPTELDSITALSKPTLSSAIKYQDSTLKSWIRTVAANDVITFNVDSAATVTRLTISLTVTRL